MLFLIAAIAAIWSFIKSAALFLLEVLACLVAQPTCRALAITDNDPVADISTFAAEPSGTEVVRVIKDPARVYIIHTMEPYLF